VVHVDLDIGEHDGEVDAVGGLLDRLGDDGALQAEAVGAESLAALDGFVGVVEEQGGVAETLEQQKDDRRGDHHHGGDGRPTARPPDPGWTR
jgi:hypothetical protein